MQKRGKVLLYRTEKETNDIKWVEKTIGIAFDLISDLTEVFEICPENSNEFFKIFRAEKRKEEEEEETMDNLVKDAKSAKRNITSAGHFVDNGGNNDHFIRKIAIIEEDEFHANYDIDPIAMATEVDIADYTVRGKLPDGGFFFLSCMSCKCFYQIMFPTIEFVSLGWNTNQVVLIYCAKYF